MVNLTRIYTRTGDNGTTSLGDFSRTSKTDPRLVAYADVDEANSTIGVVLATTEVPHDVRATLLRIQNERLTGAAVPSTREYYHRWGLTAEKLALAKPDAIVMHPGPMNRGVEIGVDPGERPGAVITQQLSNGIAVRMAVLFDLLGSGSALAPATGQPEGDAL